MSSQHGDREVYAYTCIDPCSMIFVTPGPIAASTCTAILARDEAITTVVPISTDSPPVYRRLEQKGLCPATGLSAIRVIARDMWAMMQPGRKEAIEQLLRSRPTARMQ